MSGLCAVVCPVEALRGSAMVSALLCENSPPSRYGYRERSGPELLLRTDEGFIRLVLFFHLLEYRGRASGGF